MNCHACSGFGFVHDANCIAGDCAHAGPFVTVQDEKTGRERRERARVMSCPPRSCTLCAAGALHKEELRERAARQAEAFAAAEVGR